MELIESLLSQYFGIPNSQIVEWKNVASQQNESFILWILKNKKIDTKKYEDWSFKYYKIPRLKISYFKKHTLDQNLLNQYQVNWPDHVLPLKKWKDVLYLTCLEPIKDINISEEIQWVLAPIEGLLLWKTNTKNTTSNNEAPSTTHLKAIDFGSINLSSSEKSAEKITSPPQTSTTPPKKDIKDFIFDKINIPPPRIKKQEKKEYTATEELSQSQKNTVSLSLFRKNRPHQAQHSNPITTTPKIPSHNKITTLLKTTSIHKPISQPFALSKEKKQTLPLIKIKPSSHTPQTPKPNYDDNPTKQEDHPAKKDIYDVMLNCLSVMFDQSMILMFKNSILKPKRWGSSWTKDSSTHNVILLNKPSVFQIVYKTKQKYHGYVTPNTVNDTFFKTWNMGRYPEHLTLLPLIKKNTTVVAGMLLGATSKEKGNALSLDKLDILALEASEKLLK